MKHLQTATAAELDALLPALLARAFASKLVPQNPADEPAGKLLKRIRLKLEVSVKSL
jgi:type I restriction enzyme S subunit